MVASIVFLVASFLLSKESIKYTRRCNFKGEDARQFWTYLYIFSFLHIGLLLALYFMGTLLGLFSTGAILFNPVVIVGSIPFASATGGFVATKVTLARRNQLELGGK